MAAGCHIVVTDRGSLREVVGNHGRYVPYDDPIATAAAVKDALADSPLPSRSQELEARYGLEQRERELATVLLPLIGGRADAAATEVSL
jgi:glycosyltransferase involved in cell wall biosynthesis